MSRRALAVSNMRRVPIFAKERCAAGSGKTQADRHVRDRYRDRTVVGPLAFLYRRTSRVSAGKRIGDALGHVAEWLRSGLQNRLDCQQFQSAF
jgi:hypothetical protein